MSDPILDLRPNLTDTNDINSNEVNSENLPNVNANSNQPDVNSNQPDVNSNQPDVNSNQPDVNSNRPDVNQSVNFLQLSSQIEDPTSSTFLPSNPGLLRDPDYITAPFIRSFEPQFQPISRGPFSGDLDPFTQSNNRWLGNAERGNLMGPDHFRFNDPNQTNQELDQFGMKPKFDPFGPVPGMGRPNHD